MAMVKRANGKIENFTDNDGDEVKAEEVKDVIWADEKAIKDELSIPLATDVDLDIDAIDDGDDVVAKNC